MVDDLNDWVEILAGFYKDFCDSLRLFEGPAGKFFDGSRDSLRIFGTFQGSFGILCLFKGVLRDPYGILDPIESFFQDSRHTRRVFKGYFAYLRDPLRILWVSLPT